MTHQLHVSGLNLLSRCGIAFENRYLKGMKEPRSVSLVVGAAVDRGVSADLTRKKDTGELLDASNLQDATRDALIEEWDREEIRLSEEDTEDGWEESRGKAVDASTELALLYHDKAAPAIRPTHVQRAWVLDVVGLDVQLAGTIDVQEGLTKIRDTKTSAKSPNKDTAALSLQLTTYSLAILQHDGALPEHVQLDYLVRTPKRHELKLVQLESQRTKLDLQHLIERVAVAKRVMDSGVFTPAPVESWWCSRKFCSYWGICPYAVRPVSVAT